MALLNRWIKMFERSFLLSYIDAGTGSLMIQVLIGSIAGGILALKMSWKRMKNWFRGNHSDKKKLEKSQENLVEQ